MEKKFNAFDKVIIRQGNGRWKADFYSHYEYDKDLHKMTSSRCVGDVDILPYEGNEELVGTSDSPDEEVRLEEGEWVAYYDEYDEEFKHWKVGMFKDFVTDPEGGGFFQINTYPESNHHNFVNHKVIRFSDFNPNDMEETSRHILCVKGGKIVKYKG